MKIYPVKPFISQKDIETLSDDIKTILSSGMLSTYKYTKSFEDEMKKITNTKCAIAVNTGSAAIELVLKNLDIQGKEVLVPTNTFTATVSPILRVGAKPILTDINSETLCMDIQTIENKITDRTKCILIVHIGGVISPDINKIKKLCEDNNIYLVEDCAHAHGSKINNQPAGSFGEAGCFSMYATKIITSGEGGIITTNNETLASLIRTLRDQGKNPSNANEVIQLGFSYRFPEISAALGLSQLKIINEVIRKRTKIARFYDQQLNKIEGIKPQIVPDNLITGYYKHISFLEDHINRDELKNKLKEKGVFCGGEVYAIPIHLQPIYKQILNTKKGDYPAAEKVCDRMICLPLNAWMDKDQQNFVIENLINVMDTL